MDVATARLVVLGIWVAGLAVRSFGLLRALGARRRAADQELAEVGRVPTPLPPADARERIRTALLTSPLGPFLEIASDGDDLTFRIARGRGAGHIAGLNGRFGFARSGAGTEVRARADLSACLRRASSWALVVVAAGAVAVTALPVAMLTWVVPSSDPAVRWQSLQTLQMVHLLWPPFLILHAMGRQPARLVTGILRAILQTVGDLAPAARR